MTLSMTLSCDRVMDGAFSPQPDFQVPEKEMGQHAGYNVLAPSGKLTHIVVVHAQFCLGFLKALFYRPSQTVEPYKCP